MTTVIGVAGAAGNAHADALADGRAALETKRIEAAYSAFHKADAEGAPDARYYLGLMTELGMVGPTSGAAASAEVSAARLRDAAPLYEASAEAGSAKAQNRVGLMYLNGEGRPQDYAAAAELICKAAEAGETHAQFNCGMLYDKGRGVEIDKRRAFSYFAKAANAGHVAAKNLTGFALMSGDGVARNIAGAMALFEETASVGNPVGLFALGAGHAKGYWPKSDLSRALGYYLLAAERGHAGAAKAGSVLGARLTTDERLAGEAFATKWKSQSMPESN